MLDSMRKRQNNFIFTFIILAVVAVMGFYGVGQLTKQNGTGAGDAVAWVNGDIVTRRQFQQELDRRLYQYRSLLGGQFDEKFLDQFQIPQRTLNELVQYKLLAQQAEKMDIRVTDYELADFIRNLPYFQKDGKFDREAYEKLPNRGVEEAGQRERLQIGKLQQYLSDRFGITPAELKRAYDIRETKVDLEYAKIDLNDLAKKQKVSPKAVEEFVAKNETEIKAYYDAHQKDFSDPAAVSLRQIRVGIPYQATPAQKEEARKKVDAIAKELKPDTFAAVAKAKSDDEYAKKGGDLGWVNRGTLESALETAIDRLEVGAVSEPIETTFGYFILKVEKKRDANAHPLADVKTKIAEKLVAEKSTKEFVEGKKKEWEALLAQGKPLNAELKKLGIEVKKTGPFAVTQGQVPNIGSADSIVDAVLELTKEAPVGKKLIPVQEQYYYVKLLSVEYPKAADFAKNQEMVEKSLVTAYGSELMKDWVGKLEKAATIKISLPQGKLTSLESE
jgi:peptidyl-prolyl cis-trans isomerase D